MFEFSHWFVCSASFFVFFVVCEGLSIEKSKEDGVAAFKSSAAVTLTEEEKQAAVNRHNYYRRKEGASNMQQMKWNEYLADMAAEWVSGCDFNHNHPQRDQKKLPFGYIGQNLLSSAGKMDLAKSTDYWFNEKEDFNFDSNSCKEGRMCVHYTQVVWSLTTDIGCGFAYCNSSKVKRPWWYYACNYGPGGNYGHQRVYEKGPACSKCNVTQLCDDGLCKCPSIEKSKDYGVAAFKSSAAIKLTETEKQAAVDRHNYYRRKEGASDMKKMKWNEYLADMAAEWVSGCVFKHGYPQRDQKECPFGYIGQNLLSSTGKMDLAKSTDYWFNEKRDFNFVSNSCKKDGVCGHYTQVVWSLTTDIGCGVAFCNSSKAKRPWWYYACNYGPGNYVRQKPYKKGPACSKCNGTQQCDDGLCKF